ncbi:LysR family transcriptional regulator [Chitinilyticum piscinae]|uniref:LysR family transcriptional regulator n=1 Tax=Chitinilyticum piscinae TaxID=2866724 RepID=A0A8J7FPX3_9NEIS|nr:LysR family transcriptional regulator [Chitinilyticum piscinae]MBE9608466.1 LysR family transcriptional regulator [Chitinilyticum piscinae]
MLRLNLDSLEVIDAIARRGSFAAAAEEVHRVPSAVTYLVRKLEDDLGVQLFDRSGHRARLTPAGAALLEDGRRLLRAAGELECRVKRVATGWETELLIAVDVILPLEPLYPLIAEFDALGSGTRLRLSRESLGGSWDALHERRADLLIGATQDGAASGGYISRPLGEIPMVFAVAPRHPLAAHAEPIPASVVQQYRAVVVSDSSRSLLPRTVGLLDGQEKLNVPDMPAKLAAQIAGLGCGNLPLPLARAALQSGQLVQKQLESPLGPARSCLAWRNDGAGQALQWWIRRLEQFEGYRCWMVS